MNKNKIAYLAGIIDGEGYVGLKKRYKNRQGITTQYSLVIPFLIVKKEKAELIIEYRKTVQKKPRFSVLSKKIVAKREHIYITLRRMNTKGPKFLQSPEAVSSGISDDSGLS